MLANAYIPVFAILVGYVVATLAVVPSLIIEALAIRKGWLRPSKRLAPIAAGTLHPTVGKAIGFSLLANIASTIPGLITATAFVLYASHWAMVLVHYMLTVAIELPILYLLGMQLTRRFVLIVAAANVLTYLLLLALAAIAS